MIILILLLEYYGSSEVEVPPNRKEVNRREKNKKENKEVSKKENKASFDELIDNYTNNDDLRKELKNHLAVRKAKKGALTNRAIELALKDLDKLTAKIPVNDNEAIDNAKIAIVQQSILKGWIGFFELKQHQIELENSTSGNPFFDLLREEGKMQ